MYTPRRLVNEKKLALVLYFLIKTIKCMKIMFANNGLQLDLYFMYDTILSIIFDNIIHLPNNVKEVSFGGGTYK